MTSVNSVIIKEMIYDCTNCPGTINTGDAFVLSVELRFQVAAQAEPKVLLFNQKDSAVGPVQLQLAPKKKHERNFSRDFCPLYNVIFLSYGCLLNLLCRDTINLGTI